MQFLMKFMQKLFYLYVLRPIARLRGKLIYRRWQRERSKLDNETLLQANGLTVVPLLYCGKGTYKTPQGETFQYDENDFLPRSLIVDRHGNGRVVRS